MKLFVIFTYIIALISVLYPLKVSGYTWIFRVIWIALWTFLLYLLLQTIPDVSILEFYLNYFKH